ncbi:MFS transporter [Hydrogenophaga sp. PAMC20947]|uniref:MFS transporter n=1 Tax=Hydrogenophaga sp. PAMC20947 TaxID=2565558 RepID=UPI00109E04A8|nr:MFS transporter [Hydrogenophaga sp. PAMC20947]QCB47293.1 MFS transporter [Hydrogenophaga sp. PAMC20947]
MTLEAAAINTPSPAVDAAPPQLPWGAWAGFRYGGLGLALAFLALPLYVNLPAFYADQHAVPLATLGFVLLITRVADAVLDPLIGRWIDSVFAQSSQLAWRIGAAAATVLGAGFTALFHPRGEGPLLLLWLSLALLVTYVAFSVLSIVHQTWGARLGGDAHQRARVVAWREGFGLLGVLLASVLPAVAGMSTTSAVLVLALAVGLWLLSRAPRATTTHPSTPQVQARSWAQPWHNPGFRRLLAVFLLNGIASAVPATLVLFFVRDRLQLPALEALFLGTYFGAAALSVPLWLKGVRRLGLVRCWLIGMALAVAAFIWVLGLGAGEAAGFVLVCLISGVALGADLTVPGAMLTGLVHRSGLGTQTEGVYVGWWNAATKLNLGLAAGATLPLLALGGYAPGSTSEQALHTLTLAYVVAPCVLKTLAAALLWRGWITRKELS